MEGVKKLFLQSRQPGDSSPHYLESEGVRGPANKHVLYVEVVPARYVKLEHATDSDDNTAQCIQDPLMTQPRSPCHKRNKNKHKSREKHKKRRTTDKEEQSSKFKSENQTEVRPETTLEREQSVSPLPSIQSSPSRRSISPVSAMKDDKPRKKKKRKRRLQMTTIGILESFVCNRSNCDFTATELMALNTHKKLQHRGKDFQCDQCIYRGATASDLRKHYRQHSGEIPYTCKILGCDFRAKHNNSLVYHTKKYHPSGEPMRCDASAECIFSTYLKAALKHHKMMAHGGGKSLACEQCPYKCYLMADLRKHLRVHTGENPYMCDYEGCRYACKISSNLKKHKRIHTEEKPYACDACEFRTNFINSLKVHKRTHTNERPYCCDQCGYRCNHTSNLKKHVSRLHPGAVYTIVKAAIMGSAGATI